MASHDSRSGDRLPTTSMRIKLKYPDVDTFIQKYAVNISRGGIFIATKSPKAVGTNVKFEFLLANADSTSVIRGEGQVQWTREFDPAAPTKAHGMGVKFTRLDPESQLMVERALTWRASQGGARKGDSEGITVASTSPPGATPEPTPLSATPMPMTLPEPSEPTRLEPPTAAALRSSAGRADGRSPDEHTREVVIPEAREEGVARPRDMETREIQLPEATAPQLSADDSVRIALKRHRQPKNGKHRVGDELDAMAAEWGLSPERLERVLRRKRPRMVEATAELERLLRKPAKPRPPTVQEAITLLADLLDRRK